MADILSYGCGRIIPGAEICSGSELPAEKPRLVFIDVSEGDLIDLAYSAARRKIPTVLKGVSDENLPRLRAMTPICRRNSAPAVILGSWRYLPAVAAMKEIVSTGCLGNIFCLRSSVVAPGLSLLRLQDIACWMGGKLECGVLEEGEFGVTLELKAENGWIAVEVSLDGQYAWFHSCVGGHERERSIPAADPAVSELAVLGMSLPAGKIKRFPLMMTL